jgi:hypothetical protein
LACVLLGAIDSSQEGEKEAITEMNRFDAIQFAIAVLTTTACGGSSSPSSSVSAIGLSPDPCLVARTDSKQMSAVATLPDGTKRDVTSAAGVEWSSGNVNVATVNPMGVVVGVNPGVTSITADYEGATGSVMCTIGP